MKIAQIAQLFKDCEIFQVFLVRQNNIAYIVVFLGVWETFCASCTANTKIAHIASLYQGL